MKSLRILLLALLVGALCVGCRQDDQNAGLPEDIRLTLAVTPDPAVVGVSTLLLTLTDASGQPITGASLSIKGDMAHAGMTPVLATIASSSAGVYTTPFEWTMGGDWIVSVETTLPDGRQFTTRFDLTVQSE